MTKRNILLRKCMTIMLSLALVFTMMPMVPGAVEKVHAEGELLPAPTITIDGDGVATWTEVEGASKYFWMISTGGGFADPVEGINIPQNLASWGKPGGTYTLQITARDADNNAISETASIDYVYENTHEHSWASAWSSDATHHWHECTVVGCPLDSDSAKDGYGEHVYFDNACASCGKVLELKAAPVINIDNSGVATWSAVEGASEYNVACSSFGGFVDTPSYNLAEKLAYYNKEPGVYTLQVYAVDADRNKITETATAKYDTRTVVDTFTGTSTIKAPVYGEAVTSVYDFEFTSEVNAGVPDSMGNWYKKNGETWERYEGSVFTEGTYYYSNQLRLDSASGTGATHKLADTLHITINGDIWTNNEPWIDNTYSYAYMKSPEYVVEKTALELEFIDNASFDIKNVYQNRAVTSYSVADAVVGGTEPYVFSKTSGPDWITVAEDGTVSGTPDAIGTNEKLVIKVTDALGAYKEITIDIDATLMNPADREVADTFVATSTFKAPAYGDAVATVYNFNFTSEVNARVPVAMGGWYKKVDGEWVAYTASIFGVGEYFYTNQLRLDSESGTGSTHQLPKDENISITINGETWTCDSEAWVDDTYSYVYMDSPVYVVKRELPENITLSQESYTYDGTAKEPEVTVGDLVEDIDYMLSYSDNIKAGTATVTITGIGEYGGTVNKTFTITPCTHTWKLTTTTPATCKETGVKNFECTVPGCGETKTETIAIDKNAHPKEKLTTIPAKAATCTATGLTAGEKCSACGEVTKAQQSTTAKGHKKVTIPGKVATCTATGLTAGEKCTVCGKVTKTQQTIAAKGHSLTTLAAVKATTSKSGKTAGKKCTVCGKVTTAQKTVSRIKTVKLSTAEYAYNGKTKSPSLVIKDANGKTLKNKVDYTYSKPSGRKAIGKYAYTVKFKGNYSGTKKLTLTIKPVKPTLNTPTAAKKAITVKWKKGKKAQVTGYQVMVATNSKFTKNKKTATVKGYSKVSKKMIKLKAKTKYYVRVRTYKTVKGVKIYSDWSKVKTIKTK